MSTSILSNPVFICGLGLWLLLIILVTTFRLIKQRKEIKPQAKTTQKKEKQPILTFTEFLLSLGAFALIFNFITTAENVESNEIRNRPYLWISEFSIVEKGNQILHYSSVTNTGMLPAFNVRVRKTLKHNGDEQKGEDINRFGTIYPGGKALVYFATPANKIERFRFEVIISYEDYKKRSYEFNAEYEYDPYYEIFNAVKSGETQPTSEP